MSLSKVDIRPFGAFAEDDASFTVTAANPPRPWSYIYATPELLLKIAHNGLGYAQVSPPGGILLHKQERHEVVPAFFVWFKESGSSAFSNFCSPGVFPDGAPLDSYSCAFHPDHASYHAERNQWTVETAVSIAPNDAAIIMKCSLRNNASVARRIEVIPVWRPHNTMAAMAPWDVPELYQTCRFFNAPCNGFAVETRDPGARPDRRVYSVLLTDLPAAFAETDYRRFTGPGGMLRPEALKDSATWPLDAKRPLPLDAINTPEATIGFTPVAAVNSGFLELAPGGQLDFTIVLEYVKGHDAAAVKTCVEKARTRLAPEFWSETLDFHKAAYRRWTGAFHTDTPDAALNAYLNNWLPWQLNWVSLLDRGWPTGMRGTRDCAQDLSGICLLFPGAVRPELLKIFSCQRLDGSFPRQFSTSGPDGLHDQRDYVDSGCWVFELLHDYIRHSGDRAVLDEKVRFLDSVNAITLREHAEKLLAYYLADSNKGPHGLIKIRHGDWNDSINTAGQKGIGESVMVSCQVVFMLKIAADVFPSVSESLLLKAGQLRETIRRQALNKAGFLNGIYTDGGQWLFSDGDPDGHRRVNSVVNSWGIIAGIFEKEELPCIVSILKSLKGPCGYRLFHPPLGGTTPVNHAGRLGTGDLFPGLAENGTVYNHGSQGFLIRALCSIGEGDFALDVLRHALPYDQGVHPVSVVKAEPYGVLNCYSEIHGKATEGGSPFLSGTISTLFRVVYEGFFGIKTDLEGISVSPSLPSSWKGAKCSASIRGVKLDISFQGDGVAPEVKVDGKPVEGQFIALR